MYLYLRIAPVLAAALVAAGCQTIGAGSVQRDRIGYADEKRDGVDRTYIGFSRNAGEEGGLEARLTLPRPGPGAPGGPTPDITSEVNG